MDHDLDVTPFLSSNSMAHNYEPVGLRFKLTEHSDSMCSLPCLEYDCVMCPTFLAQYIPGLHP